MAQRQIARVAILLCTYNSARFLPAQLASIAAQSHKDWCLFVSDDGSSDDTLQLVKRMGDIRKGPGEGFVRNFLSLACDPALSFDYYAYCDHDDIWEPDKLKRAIECLAKARGPALYCSATTLIDDKDFVIGRSARPHKPPRFDNALVQSIASGNTMVFNEAARQLLMVCGSEVQVPSHDWWTYILVSGAGGNVYYDTVPQVRYRLHANNLIGSNVGLWSRLWRFYQFMRGRFQHWSDMHVAALEPFSGYLTPENHILFWWFRHARLGRLIAAVLVRIPAAG